MSRGEWVSSGVGITESIGVGLSQRWEDRGSVGHQSIDGRQASGMHPTGMLSCCMWNFVTIKTKMSSVNTIVSKEKMDVNTWCELVRANIKAV